MKYRHTVPYAAVLLMAAVTGSFWSLNAIADDSAFGSATADGYFWYKDKPKVKPKPKPKVEEKPKSEAKPEEKKAEPKEEKKQDFGSAAWIREKQKELLELAISNPTEENVRAYLYVNRLMLDRADEFARISKKVTDADPMLSESVRVPISALARQQALWQIDQAKEGIIKDLSKKAGIWMFFDSSCSFCQSQFQVTQMLAEKYGMQVRYVSTDGGTIPGMKPSQIRYDRGAQRARSIGIQLTPATVLVAPPDRMAVVAHGAMSMSDLEQKIVTAAIDTNLADPNLTNIAKLNERGMINRKDLERAKQKLNNPENMDEVVKMLNGIIKNNM